MVCPNVLLLLQPPARLIAAGGIFVWVAVGPDSYPLIAAMPYRRPACLALLTVLILVGCRDQEITAYRAPKDPAPAAMPAMAPASSGTLPEGHPPVGPANPGPLPDGHPPIGPASGGATGNSMANTTVPTGSGSFTWTAPAHWTGKPLGPMRKGSFAIKGADGAEADLAITAFPGDTGGMLANLNRWRGQISLPPIGEAQVDAAIEHFDGDGLHFDIIDLVGTANGTPTRILGAVLSRPAETWFFKLMGPDALVASQKDAFRAFLRTVKEPSK